MFSVLLAGCGIREMLPQSPVLTGWERSRGWASEEPSTATYTGEPVVTFPVLPVQVWGAAYDLDLVIVTRHPDWNMHEYAMLRTPRGPVWLAKDAREGTMEQTIVADIDDIQSWIPEIPVRRKAWPLEVEDASTAEWLDLSIRYENIDGEPVEVTYSGKPPDLLQRKRNGSTFGHSRDVVLAAVDVSERRFGRRASVTIDGKKQRISRLAGLVPFRMVLAQAQGGLAVADIFQEAGAPWEVEPDAREVVGSVPPEAADAGMARIDSRAQPAFTTTHPSHLGGVADGPIPGRVPAGRPAGAPLPVRRPRGCLGATLRRRLAVGARQPGDAPATRTRPPRPPVPLRGSARQPLRHRHQRPGEPGGGHPRGLVGGGRPPGRPPARGPLVDRRPPHDDRGPP